VGYYYSEGMAAPMGMFTNAAREPRALLVVDRTLQRTAPGVYETAAWLERPGTYTVAFLLDSPQAVNCWNVVVEPDPRLPQSARRRMKTPCRRTDSHPSAIPKDQLPVVLVLFTFGWPGFSGPQPNRPRTSP
jgi:hypothetical protein